MNVPIPRMSPTVRRRDPREILAGDRRHMVLAMLRLGASRRMAARQAGCAHATIARTAARDRSFAAQLAEAESHAHSDALIRPRGAAAENKLGRAAAWIVQHGRVEPLRHTAPPGHVPANMTAKAIPNNPTSIEWTISLLEKLLANERTAVQ
jgi:hypothetical protein